MTSILNHRSFALAAKDLTFVGSVRRNILFHSFTTVAGAMDKRVEVANETIILGDGLYYQQSTVSTGGRRPLVVVAGWMSAKQSQLKKYLSFYHSKGIDTLSFAVGPRHVLYPEEAQALMTNVLRIVHLPETNKLPHMPSSLLFHHFSVGGFLYGKALLAMGGDPLLKNAYTKIKSQIFDSPPDYQNIPVGISKSIGVPKLLEKPVEIICRGFLKLTENSAGVLHRRASNSFHENDVPCPSLWFYSKSDPVADWKDCEIVINKWIGRGIDVERCVWDVSPHVLHAREDPARYFDTLDKFLSKCRII